MKILLDNCVSRKFAKHIVGHEVTQARQIGFSDLVNGKLLAAAEDAGFEVLVTVDKNLRHQQNMSSRRLSVITLAPLFVFYEDLVPLADPLLEALSNLSPGSHIVIAPDQAS